MNNIKLFLRKINGLLIGTIIGGTVIGVLVALLKGDDAIGGLISGSIIGLIIGLIIGKFFVEREERETTERERKIFRLIEYLVRGAIGLLVGAIFVGAIKTVVEKEFGQTVLAGIIIIIEVTGVIISIKVKDKVYVVEVIKNVYLGKTKDIFEGVKGVIGGTLGLIVGSIVGTCLASMIMIILLETTILVSRILLKLHISVAGISLEKIFPVVLAIMIILVVPVGIVTFCYFVRTYKINWGSIAFIVGASFVYLYLSFTVKVNFLTIGSMLVDLILNRIYQYKIECKEVYFSHKLGEEFNKEYFDLYYNRKNIIYRFNYYLAYLSTLLYIKWISKISVDNISWLKELLNATVNTVNDPLSKFFLDFGITLIVFVILWVLSRFIFYVVFKFFDQFIPFEKYIKKLLKTKGDNFGKYTDSEKDIILE